MRNVTLTRACWLDDDVNGDAGRPLALDDAKAREAVEVHRVAVYSDSGAPQEIPVVKADPGFEFPAQPRVVDVPEDFGQDPRYIEEDIARSRAEPEMKMPWSNASKAAWTAWAVHCGCEPARANAMSKNALMNTYGERL